MFYFLMLVFFIILTKKTQMKKFSTEQGLVTPTKLYENDYMLFSEKYESDETVFAGKFLDVPKIRPQFYKVLYSEIIEITPLPDYKDPTIRIQIDPENELDLFHLDYKTQAEYSEALQFLISKANLKPIEVEKSSSKVWIKNILYTVVVGVLGGVIYNAALLNESGEHINISGSRRGIKQLIVNVGETLGSVVSLILWIVLVAVFVFITFNSYKKSKTKTTVYVK